jgi:pSer/pThr/pTyr-binding forkhead associated (FHA) protein
MGDWLAVHGSTPVELQARVAAEKAGAPFVELRDGEGRQLVIPLPAGGMTIGRSPASGLPLPWDGQVSRTHAAVEAIDGVWTVRDDGLSTNGTFVNEEKVHGRRRLHHLDVVRVGRTRIRFHAPGEADVGRTEIAIQFRTPELTTAQRRVLAALAEPADAPASNEEIAAALQVSVETVKTHMRALFEAFGLTAAAPFRKRLELVRLAHDLGLAEPHERR